MNKEEFINNTQLFQSVISKQLTDVPYGHLWLNGIKKMLQSKMNLEVIRRDLKVLTAHCQHGSVLDFGCGSGYLALLLAKMGYNVNAIDINSYVTYNKSDYNDIMTKDQQNLWTQLTKIDSRLTFSHYTDQIPYGDKTFDIVVAYAVLEHVPEKLISHVLGEIKRVLKPKGILFISRLPRTLSIPEYLAKTLRLDAHEKLYSDKEAVQVLENEGFKIIEQSLVEIVPAYPETITNALAPTLLLLDKILSHTPLRYFSHHLRIICEKIS